MNEQEGYQMSGINSSMADIEEHVPIAGDDKAPIIEGRQVIGRLNRSLSCSYAKGEAIPIPSHQVLGWIGGVFGPVALAEFSTTLFLRLGFVVGQSGIILTLVQFALAYIILYMTVLSICAISTNGEVKGGGAYYMISRALGPEFGGSIGCLFFFANILGCALYISGTVESLADNFGIGGTFTNEHFHGIPSGTHWWSYLYATCVLLFCLGVCLIGGSMFARTSLIILIVVVICLLSVMISMFGAKRPFCVPFPNSNKQFPPPVNETERNNTQVPCADFTGFNGTTFLDNVYGQYGIDYATGATMTFASVFAVLFSSVTGIMNGANMSGELRDPSLSIPRGTLIATTFTLSTYIILAFLSALTCTRDLLLNNYLYMQYINFWQPFVVIGILSATLSAALGNLIGASRILEALARDELFGFILRPATITTRGGNPFVAVFMSWILVQLVLLIGSLNAIAPITSVFFLLAYAATNLACLALELASAPNFRPSFRFFSWHTCLLGLVGSMVMCFLINAVSASIALAIFLVLVIALHLRSYQSSWGSISQALIFHQVRKYLLMLDSRKDHVKYWRPQMLLLVSNPRASCDLVDFINDIKKSGLYIIGHVQLGNLDAADHDPCQRDLPQWLSLVDHLKVKAFVELTMAQTVREGMLHLLRISGLGGMKPNTVCLGFYDNASPEDTFLKPRFQNTRRSRVRFYGGNSEAGSPSDELFHQFPRLRSAEDVHALGVSEYVQMVRDSLKLDKNVCLFRHFSQLDKDKALKRRMNVDVWPIDFSNVSRADCFDKRSLFLLQLACILTMSGSWRNRVKLRVFLCWPEYRERLQQLLIQLRIPATIVTVSTPESKQETEEYDQWQAANQLMRDNCMHTALVFLTLPEPPEHKDRYESYLADLTRLTEQMPPTVLVYGTHPVTSTTL